MNKLVRLMFVKLFFFGLLLSMNNSAEAKPRALIFAIEEFPGHSLLTIVPMLAISSNYSSMHWYAGSDFNTQKFFDRLSYYNDFSQKIDLVIAGHGESGQIINDVNRFSAADVAQRSLSKLRLVLMGPCRSSMDANSRVSRRTETYTVFEPAHWTTKREWRWVWAWSFSRGWFKSYFYLDLPIYVAARDVIKTRTVAENVFFGGMDDAFIQAGADTTIGTVQDNIPFLEMPFVAEYGKGKKVIDAYNIAFNFVKLHSTTLATLAQVLGISEQLEDLLNSFSTGVYFIDPNETLSFSAIEENIKKQILGNQNLKITD